MESYGALLKRTREAKELSIDTVERETSITRQYLEALEREEDNVFPGEPYLVGFLKNYAEYLELNSDDLLRLYRAKKIQESPVPVELLAKRKPKFIAPLIATLSVLLLAGAGVYLYFFVLRIPEKRIEQERLRQENKKVHEYRIGAQPVDLRVYKGDQILVPTGGEGDGVVVLTVSGTVDNKLWLQTPAGLQQTELSEERELDIDGDGKADVVVLPFDIDPKDESRGAEVHLFLKDAEGILQSDLEASQEANAGAGSADAAPVTTIRGDASKRVVIHEDNRAYSFTLTITFRAPCIFRYRIDSSQDRVEDYYKNGDTLTLTAANRIRLWMSNSNALRIQVKAGLSNYDLDVGRAGQVEVEDIRWVASDMGRALVVQSVD